jgi:hypothetical protein
MSFYILHQSVTSLDIVSLCIIICMSTMHVYGLVITHVQLIGNVILPIGSIILPIGSIILPIGSIILIGTLLYYQS